jgi:hypothetical protein
MAFLEGRVVEQSRALGGIRDAIVGLEQRLDRRFAAVDVRFAALEAKLDQRTGALEARLDERTAALDEKMSRQFTWTVGIQVTRSWRSSPPSSPAEREWSGLLYWVRDLSAPEW